MDLMFCSMPIKKDPRSRWNRIEGLHVGFACLTIKVSLNHFKLFTIPAQVCQPFDYMLSITCSACLPQAGTDLEEAL